MLNSLKAHCPEAVIYVLCMDLDTEQILKKINLSNVNLIALGEIEDADLLRVKDQRGIAEYCWTLSPCLPSYILNKCPHVDFITYLDADLFFFSDLKPLFEEISQASIVIIEHRFTPRLRDQEVKGRFCVEWVSFRRDLQGLECLERWREQCIEWCFYRLEDGKMGDQKYLDPWPKNFTGCHILKHEGAGVAPWNYPQYSILKGGNNDIFINSKPLIFYHFHQFQILDDGQFNRLSSFYTEEAPEPELIYAPYELAINRVITEVRMNYPNFNRGFKSKGSVVTRRFAQKFLSKSIKDYIRKFVRY